MSERLTKRKDYGCACWNGDQNIVTHRRYTELLDALAKYEDVTFGADGNEIISLARLSELADAEREGRVVVLPIKPDELFYAIDSDFEGNVSVLEYAFDCGYMKQVVSEWGKTAFGTRAEAERALAEKGAHDGEQ